MGYKSYLKFTSLVFIITIHKYKYQKLPGYERKTSWLAVGSTKGITSGYTRNYLILHAWSKVLSLRGILSFLSEMTS